MANIESAKKRARQAIVRRQRNLARKTAIKTAVKKVLAAIETSDYAASLECLKEAESQMRRARGKGLLHSNTVDRKVSRLAIRVQALKAGEKAPKVVAKAPKASKTVSKK